MGFKQILLILFVIIASLLSILTLQPQVVGDTITGKEVNNLIKLEYPQAYVIVLDNEYTLLNTSKMRLILEDDDTNRKTYVNETFDCDDFAFTLWRNIRTEYGNVAVGVVRIRIGLDVGHILNFYIDKNLTIHLVEPQTDVIDPSYNITDHTWFLI